MKFKEFLKLKKSFLLEDSRVQNLSIEDYREFAEYCKRNDFSESLKKMIETDVLFFRGQKMSNSNKNFFLIDPSGIERDSRTKLPFTYVYNSMINTKGDWSEFPNRNKSVIFTNSLDYASAYGDAFLVIPQKCKIGICPYGDIFYCFRSIGIKNIIETNDIMPLNSVIGLNNKTDWESVKKILYKYFLIKINLSYYEMRENLFIQNFLKELENEDYKGFSEILNNLFTPENLKFEFINFPNEINKLKRDTSHELWTESKCLLLYNNINEEEHYLNFLKNEVYPFL